MERRISIDHLAWNYEDGETDKYIWRIQQKGMMCACLVDHRQSVYSLRTPFKRWRKSHGNVECTQKGLSLVAVMEANRKPQTASGDEVNVDMEATATWKPLPSAWKKPLKSDSVNRLTNNGRKWRAWVICESNENFYLLKRTPERLQQNFEKISIRNHKRIRIS